MSAAPATGGGRSLFVQLLDWMLVPLVIVWPLAILFTYLAARTIADDPHDRDLVITVSALTRVVPAAPPAPHDFTLLLPPVASELLRSGGPDKLWFQVATLDGGILLGDSELPPLEGAELRETGAVTMKDGEIGGERVRIAYVVFRPDAWDRAVAVQVGETLLKRERLAGEITRVVVGVLIALLGILVALMLYGLKQGLEPLNQLRRLVLARSPEDLSPIPETEAPVEVAPLVATVNDQVARMRAAVEAQRRFIADAAHQMKTPLAGLKMQAELAQRAQGEADLRERLAQIGAAADRAQHLVQRLLALARADEAATARRSGEPVDLNAVARAACESLAPRALERGIDFGFEPCAGAPRVLGEPTLLGELVANLAENAVKYTPPGGHVTVRVTCDPETALEIEDTGPGIPEAERDKVFERFYRVAGSPAAGAGLGLPIVKAIATQHGARVTVEAGSQGRGCRFRVSGWRQAAPAGGSPFAR